jgi:hypothetical protein
MELLVPCLVSAVLTGALIWAVVSIVRDSADNKERAASYKREYALSQAVLVAKEGASVEEINELFADFLAKLR